MKSSLRGLQIYIYEALNGGREGEAYSFFWHEGH
jgi:hypothetical protein